MVKLLNIFLNFCKCINLDGQPCRSQNEYELYEHMYKPERFVRRLFTIAAPILWNRLPIDNRKAPSVDYFKSKLKTHLDKRSYDV